MLRAGINLLAMSVETITLAERPRGEGSGRFQIERRGHAGLVTAFTRAK